MKIAILDDCAEDRSELRLMLNEYFAARGVESQVCEFSSSADFLRVFSPGEFQIAFIDIFLDGENGMDAARRAFEEDPECRLVFFTVSYDYAVDSYLVRAAYYLTKPIDFRRLHDALNICCRALDNKSVELTVGCLPTRLQLKDICFVDCENRDVRVHLSDRTLAVAESFFQLSSVLMDDGRFLSCNRNVAVNMEQIAEVREGDFVLKNGARVPIRVRRRAELKRAWLAYSLKHLEREAAT